MKNLLLSASLGFLLLTGCTSMWNAIGIASTEQFKAQTDKDAADLSALQQKVTELQAALDEKTKDLQRLADLNQTIVDLKEQVKTMPSSVLNRLIVALQKEVKAESDALK